MTPPRPAVSATETCSHCPRTFTVEVHDQAAAPAGATADTMLDALLVEHLRVRHPGALPVRDPYDYPGIPPWA